MLRKPLAGYCVAVATLSLGLAYSHLSLAAPGQVDLAPHRAIYDLKLSTTGGKRPVESARGRILYDLSAGGCDGYALEFRHVAELDFGEGRTLRSDLRSKTWEDRNAKSFRFNSQNFVDENLIDDVEGKAERKGESVAVNLKKPERKAVDVPTGVMFPAEHIRGILEAARAGKNVLNRSVYDGSETGEKIYDTMTIIGQPISPERKPDDAAGKEPALTKLKRWPITISYFDRSKHEGEQTPAYAIRFEIYENGISRGLLLDYSDFVIAGEMIALEMKRPGTCAR